MLTPYRHYPTFSAARLARKSIRHAVVLATQVGEPDRWTHFVGEDRYGFRSRQFARSDYLVMRDVAHIRRLELSLRSVAWGMSLRSTMADETAPRQFCDRGTK